jgi:hypothetical protein
MESFTRSTLASAAKPSQRRPACYGRLALCPSSVREGEPKGAEKLVHRFTGICTLAFFGKILGGDW